MRFDEFIGGSYPSASPNADISRTVNLVLEVNESAGSKGKKMLIGRPGLFAFTNLATAPVRGLASGEDRLFAAAGGRLYEISSAGIPTELGVINTDLTNSPVQMFLNGRQLFVVASEAAYVHDGVRLIRCIDGGSSTKEGEAAISLARTGLVNTVGTAVTWVSGNVFEATQQAAGQWITIAGVLYQIQSFNSTTSLTLTTSAGNQTNVPYWSGSLLTRTSGDNFDAVTHAAGNLVVVEGGTYEVAVFLGSTQIILKQSVGLTTGKWRSLVATPEVTSSGTVDVFASTVNYVSGQQFDASTHAAGNQIIINGIWYTIQSFNSSVSLTLYNVASNQTGANYLTYKVLTALTGGYLNGYFLAQQKKTLADGSDGRKVRISGLLDGSSWDALDFVSAEARPDSLQSIIVNALEVYMLGRGSYEVFRATDGESILSRDPGAVAQIGSLCRWAPVTLAGSVFFIAGNEEGQISAIEIRGFQPRRISTAAVETAWQGYVEAGYGIADAIGFSYVTNGHSFWVISFPNADKTWVYDAGTQVWSEWGEWDGAVLHRHRGRCHTSVFGYHFQGDYQTGTIYRSSFDYGRDGLRSIRYQRTAPHLHSGEEDLISYTKFQLDMDTGTAIVGVVNTIGTFVEWVGGDTFDNVAQTPGKTITISGVTYTIATFVDLFNLVLTTSAGNQTNASYSVEPPITLEWSDTDGATWSTPKTATTGAFGDKKKRVIWRRLGAGRDRCYRVTTDTKSKQGWLAASLKVKGEK